MQAKGTIERIGEPAARLPIMLPPCRPMAGDLAARRESDLDTVGLRASRVTGWCTADRTSPTRPSSTTRLVAEIRDLIPLAPLHNPGAVAGIEAARGRFAVPHVAVFDTAFFTTPAAGGGDVRDPG